MCKGTAPGILEERGYTIIKQPRADVEVFQLFELHKRVLHPLNTSVAAILTPAAKAQLPAPNRGQTFAPIQGKHVQEVEAGLGASILKHVIPGYGALLEAKYARARVFEFRFLEVKRDSIDVVQTELALGQVAANDLPGSLREAGANKLLFLVTSLLRSSDIGVKAHAAGHVDLNTEITAEELGKAGVKYVRNKQDESEIIYKGDAELVFAIEARRFVFVDGKFRRLRVEDQSPVAMAATSDGDAALLEMNADGQWIKPLSVLDIS